MIGALLGFLVIWFRMPPPARHGGRHAHMLIIILTPFIIYLIAEEFHLSGILAVVAAGVTHAVERDRMRSASIKLRVVSDSTWSVILHAKWAGVHSARHEIPGVGNQIWSDPAYNNGQVLGYIFLITAVLILSFCMGLGIYEPSVQIFHADCTIGRTGSTDAGRGFLYPAHPCGQSSFPERSLMLFICAGVIH